MSIVGIIAELNPLHNGHKYLINEAKKYGKVVVSLSGNFVQRGDTAIYDKRLRAKAALASGADLVLELPIIYSMSTAQNFALGGVAELCAIGCDTIMFGSECGKVEPLIKTAEILESKKFKETLPKYLEQGITFASARQKAAEDCGAPINILDGANNNLAIEYIMAARNINSNITFKTVKRVGAMHDSEFTNNEFSSASLLREKIKQNNFSDCERFIPKEVFSLLKNQDYSDIKRLDTAILAVLRSNQAEDFKNLPDLSEGMENKLLEALKTAKSVEELYNGIKSKRYTLARVRRLVLSAFLNIDNRLFMKAPPYLRVLGFSKSGEEILRSRCSTIPVIMRVGEIENLSEDAKYMFEVENRATNLYNLSFKAPKDCGEEYTAPLIKI